MSFNVSNVFKVFLMVAGCSLSLVSAEQQKDVKLFFQRTCAACHGVDGSGRGLNGQKLPGRVLSDSRWQGTKKDADLVKSILKGKGGMPAFQSQLSEMEAESLVAEIIRPLAARKK
ncbi:MAG: cytochrome c [Holophagaceae bacterium]|nr:cytochrome c [Holophagaceae bacterium]